MYFGLPNGEFQISICVVRANYVPDEKYFVKKKEKEKVLFLCSRVVNGPTRSGPNPARTRK